METPKLVRSLGLLDATLLVAGSMIGSGIFIVTSIMAKDVGSVGWILLLWVLTGLITVMAALSYGELAGMMPDAGGQYVYIQRAYGKMTSFLYGWTVFTVIQTGVIAAVAMAFSKYSAVFFPALNNVFLSIEFNDLFLKYLHWNLGNSSKFSLNYAQVVAIASIVSLTFFNAKGIQNGKWIQVIFTLAKLVALFGLIILGLSLGIGSDVWKTNFSDIWSAKQTVLNAYKETYSVKTLTGLALAGALGATIINSLF